MRSFKNLEKEWEDHVSLHIIDLLSFSNLKNKKDDLCLDLTSLSEMENDFVEKLSFNYEQE